MLRKSSAFAIVRMCDAHMLRNSIAFGVVRVSESMSVVKEINCFESHESH